MNNIKNTYEKVKKATVAIAFINKEEAEEPFTIIGSGFCIDAEGIIITCRHVIEAFMKKTISQQLEKIPQKKDNHIHILEPVETIIPHAIFYDTVSNKNGLFAFPVRAKHMVAKTDCDIAGFSLWPHSAIQNGFPCLEIEEYSNISEGDAIGICGFPLGNYLYRQLGTVTSSFSKGIISSIIPSPNVSLKYLKGFQLNITATNGNSGGPVFLISSGKVFGVLSCAPINPSGNIVHGIVKAEPIYNILRPNFIEDLKKGQIFGNK
jgi:hypothetical protein